MAKKIEIEIGSDAWVSLLAEIASNYSDGTLIPHEWLRRKFGLKQLQLKDFDTVEDFIEGLKRQQFTYMSMTDKLRWQLLEDYKMYIKNIIGEGYAVIPPQEQTKYGYDEFLKSVRKAIRESDLIMNNVRFVPDEQRHKDNDIRAKCSILKQMLQSIKR